MNRAQINIFEEIVVDNFAGGGGTSTGIELATGRPVAAAINHDPDAILMHKTNHMHTAHYCEDVWAIDPKKVCQGRPVGLAWFSPDCKHHSKAKGGKPVDRKIRGLSWVALRWAMDVEPRVIMMENVEEIQDWGPVITGPDGKQYPDPGKKGQTFQAFVGMLTTGVSKDHPGFAEACEFLHITPNSAEASRLSAGLGYKAEWRELVAADFGAPTTRKRFFLIARRDKRPIVWPETTHAPKNSPEVKAGLKKPWRSAAEIIDWSLPCPSIFATRKEIKTKYGLRAQRPLQPNTLRRVARGVDKFVIRNSEPFLVVVNHAGEFRGQSLIEPLQTVTAKHGYGVIDPIMTPIPSSDATRSVKEPIGNQRCTVSSAEDQPSQPIIVPLTMHNNENAVGTPITDPINTVTASGAGGHQMLIAPTLIQYHTEQSASFRGQKVSDPLMTIDASNRYGLAAATLVKYYGNDQYGQNVQSPLHTITAKDREGVAKVSLVKAAPGVDLQNWPAIRELLNTYCGYHLANDEMILFAIGGVWYFMSDIGLRMLTPRELYRANGFPDDYIIDRDYMGHVYGKTKQVARCGNAVPPPFATALVRANFPEWCDMIISTMKEFRQAITA